MNIYGDCLCPECSLETRFLLESLADDQFLMLGDTINSTEEIAGMVECDYCQHSFKILVVVVDQVISAFMNVKQFTEYQEGQVRVNKAALQVGLEKEKEQDLTQFHETFSAPFKEQPFEPSTPLIIAGEKWHIETIYKKENVETDLTTRLLSPSLDEYWYRVKNDQGLTKWCVVVNTKEVQHVKKGKRKNIATALKRTNTATEWFEVEVISSEEQTEEQNAILMVEPPYLKETEQKFDVTDTLFKTTKMFEKKLGESLTLYGYEYLAGVRLYAFTNDGEMEMDIFAPTIEEALSIIQEQFSVSVDEQ